MSCAAGYSYSPCSVSRFVGCCATSPCNLIDGCPSYALPGGTSSNGYNNNNNANDYIGHDTSTLTAAAAATLLPPTAITLPAQDVYGATYPDGLTSIDNPPPPPSLQSDSVAESGSFDYDLDSSNNAGMIAGIVAGVLAFLLLILGIWLFLYVRKRRAQRDGAATAAAAAAAAARGLTSGSRHSSQGLAAAAAWRRPLSGVGIGSWSDTQTRIGSSVHDDAWPDAENKTPDGSSGLLAPIHFISPFTALPTMSTSPQPPPYSAARTAAPPPELDSRVVAELTPALVLVEPTEPNPATMRIPRLDTMMPLESRTGWEPAGGATDGAAGAQSHEVNWGEKLRGAHWQQQQQQTQENPPGRPQTFPQSPPIQQPLRPETAQQPQHPPPDPRPHQQPLNPLPPPSAPDVYVPRASLNATPSERNQGVYANSWAQL